MVDIERKELMKKMYGWSKWGGANRGLVFYEDDQDEWTCQSCAQKQAKVLPAYIVPLDGDHREYCRICSSCKFIAVRDHVEDIQGLIVIVRRKVHLFTELLENL